MKKDTEIPCSTCSFWKPEKKSFVCNPNKCKKLAGWLMSHIKDNISDPQKKMIKYIV